MDVREPNTKSLLILIFYFLLDVEFRTWIGEGDGSYGDGGSPREIVRWARAGARGRRAKPIATPRSRILMLPAEKRPVRPP